MQVDLKISAKVKKTPRIQQLASSFQVPLEEKLSREWAVDFPIEERDWNVGLIVGASGSGKSQIARKIYGADVVDGKLDWGKGAVVDAFEKGLGISEITSVCGAVGFNTVPSWMRPFHTLSNGEQFRVDLARRLLEGGTDDVIVVDEFSSVVDRQVAKVASNSVQKYVRGKGKQFVAVTCHYDVIDWLNPDWVLEPSTCSFRWRSLRRRPSVSGELLETTHASWKKFAPYHYLTAELNKTARCYVFVIDGEEVGFTAMLPRPISNGKNNGSVVWGFSRTVVLPDWQGLGIARVMKNNIASAYHACGFKVRSYPAHPAYYKSMLRDGMWRCIKKYGTFTTRNKTSGPTVRLASFGGRNNATFEYVGDPMEDKFTAMKIARMIK